ncbi:MAG: DUF6259 domain-containing protein [Verrucomicrobiota bacterium JB024]|nr:DUF6259 domain-containing protein [Verrucomicrobiota bacterium JB024]
MDLLSPSPAVSTTDTADTYTLSNAHLELVLALDGRLLRLVNRNMGHNYAGNAHLWRVYLQEDNELDIEIAPATFPTGLLPRLVCHASDRLTLTWPMIWRDGQPTDIEVEIDILLEEDEVRWGIQLSNRQSGVTLREVHFPLIGNMNMNHTPTLITSQLGGDRIPDLREKLVSKPKLYVTSDHLFSAFTLEYPHTTHLNAFTFTGEGEGLYFGCHRHPIEPTVHQFRHYPETAESASPGVEAGFVLFPHLAAGEDRWTCKDYVVSPYCGTWHVAARKYRAWADTWFRKPSPPVWLRRLNGWQRIILQHQYGIRHYRYEDLPQIHQDGARAGINTFLMFGWHRRGMDNNYPDYVTDPRLGTEEELRRGIEAFNREGGHVFLYANGRLIDTTSEYYQTIGRRISIKDVYGNEVRDAYKFQGAGNFSLTAARTFVMACPSSPEWFELLCGLVDKAIDWGCHSLFLDQMGVAEYPCCDTSHGHPPFWSGTMQQKADILRRLRDYMRKRDPKLALGIEWPADITAQHADYVHNAVGGESFIEWFRYIFPEVILTDREIRDDTNAEWLVNLSVVKGLRSDVEIYRCRKTIAEAPRYESWLMQVNTLRQKYAELLLEGRYVDTEGFVHSNATIIARAFRDSASKNDDGDLLIVATQRHADEQIAKFTVPGLTLKSWDGIVPRGNGGTKNALVESDSEGTEVSVTLPRNALVLLHFSKYLLR